MAKRFIGGGDSDVAPAGSVQAFAGAEAPYGWLLCQGQELNITDYPKLYEAIGSTWNTQVNPTSGSAYSAPAAGKFRLPDFRGSFLRGAGSPHEGDTCTLGGHQAQKTKSHAHNFKIGVFTQTSTYADHVGFYQSSLGKWGSRPGFIGGNGGFNTASNSSDSETRPLNQGVQYIIKE